VGIDEGEAKNVPIEISYCAALQAFMIKTMVVTIQTAVTQLTTLSNFRRDISHAPPTILDTNREIFVPSLRITKLKCYRKLRCGKCLEKQD
jgi:hypothetical protein